MESVVNGTTILYCVDTEVFRPGLIAARSGNQELDQSASGGDKSE